MSTTDAQIEQAAQAISRADALLIGTGAGIGVDSGLPDFRGTEGFWRAYPPLQKLGLRFEQVANPRWFQDDPQLVWGFYGHRMNLYRATNPHAGFKILHAWSESKAGGAFVFTSNVDGHFQRAGFNEGRVWEVHGSILFGQCVVPCSPVISDASDLEVHVDEESFRAREPLPLCPRCGDMARPNILMFSDYSWNDARSDEQQERFIAWARGQSPKNLAIIEMGAGTAIPSVRRLSESLQAQGATLIRINPREPEGPKGTISIASGALSTLEKINAALPST